MDNKYGYGGFIDPSEDNENENIGHESAAENTEAGAAAGNEASGYCADAENTEYGCRPEMENSNTGYGTAESSQTENGYTSSAGAGSSQTNGMEAGNRVNDTGMGNGQISGNNTNPERSTAGRTYEFYEVNKESVTPPPLKTAVPHPQKPTPKKEKSGIGKKFGVTITMALVFGLVAGLVFQGVNILGNKIQGDTQSADNTVQNVQMIPSSQETTDEGVTAEETVAKETSAAGTLSVADIARNAMPSVVAITAISVQEVQNWFGQVQQYEGVGSGSGIIIGQNDTELLIATNNHVVADSKNLSVSFYGDEVNGLALEEDAVNTRDVEDIAEAYAENSVAAQIKGTDAANDLAVIAVKKEDIPEETMAEIKVAALGDSDSLVVGEQVVAIGNALGYGQSVTSGYVSALDRSIDTDESGNTSSGLIQTDAAINPGNSGGALLNMKGEVIGINSAKFADETVEGMGFAIPLSTAEPILGDLMNRETRSLVGEDEASYMGIACKEVSAEVSEIYMIPTGVFISSVVKGGPAEKAGIQPGDVLTKIDGTQISSYEELTNQLQYYAAGETIDVVVQRADSGEYKEHTLSITLGSKKDAEGN